MPARGKGSLLPIHRSASSATAPLDGGPARQSPGDSTSTGTNGRPASASPPSLTAKKSSGSWSTKWWCMPMQRRKSSM